MSATLPTLYQNFIHKSRYARWLPEEKRRETWSETVDRYMDYMCDQKCKGKIPAPVRKELREAILNLEVMPSMRCLMTAGPALKRDEAAGFNCSALPIDDSVAFDELFYLLLCGCGVGFSVERQFIATMPIVADKLRESKSVLVVEDSKIGWANALRELISMLYQGRVPTWDTSGIRPSGAILKTFGGRASGPEPLENMFRQVVAVFHKAVGRRLNSIECHDICCYIADAVVVGGVRRAAMISLSNPSDNRMRDAKTGQWWIENPQRKLANNSIAYTEKPDIGMFMDDWKSLYESRSGERGIVNRVALQKFASMRGTRDPNVQYLVNPCAEIIMRPCGFCNLSEVVVRPGDTLKDLKRKIRLATILGTMQSTLTKFRYLRKIWEDNAKEEALLGVSLTGIYDNPLTRGDGGRRELGGMLRELRDYSVEVNEKWAAKIGANPSAAITTVKPSGTVSQLCDTASGMHPRYSEYYTRRVRADKNDPLAKLMEEQGFPCEDDITRTDHTSVFSFPISSPESPYYHSNMKATDHLEIWKVYQQSWCHHKPSVTVNVGEDEWLEVGAWVYRNFNIASGISFLPKVDHVYQQAPYEECSEERYNEMVKAQPEFVDWARLSEYEMEDETVGSQTLSCTGGSCEIVDLVTE